MLLLAAFPPTSTDRRHNILHCSTHAPLSLSLFKCQSPLNSRPNEEERTTLSFCIQGQYTVLITYLTDLTTTTNHSLPDQTRPDQTRETRPRTPLPTRIQTKWIIPLRKFFSNFDRRKERKRHPPKNPEENKRNKRPKRKNERWKDITDRGRSGRCSS